MDKAVVVTDSSASIPANLVRELDIRIVPILLIMGGHTFRDGQDISAEEVYDWIRSDKPPPTTGSPSTADFVRIYSAAAATAVGIASIHISPELSGIYNAARVASRQFSHVPIRVVDCRTAAMGQGFAVLEAARAAAAGADLETVVARAEEVSARMNLLATIDTLEYLHRGGRIGGPAALLGTVLQIKPVLCVTDGRVELFARPRTKARAVWTMLEQIGHAAQMGALHVAILHADAQSEAQQLAEEVVHRFNCVELYVTPLTPVMGAHTGPGVLGVAYYVD